MRLKPTSLSDLAEILEMERDLANIDFILSYDLERHQRVINESDEDHLAIIDENSKLVGFVILTGLTNENRSIELRRIVISNKGKGFGSKAIDLTKKKCFDELNCNRLWLDVFEHNLNAIYVYEKLGFLKEGVLRECIKTSEGYKNLVIMSILRTDYEKGPNTN